MIDIVNTYIKFKDKDGFKFFSLDYVIHNGKPIDEDGKELVLFNDNLYQWKDAGRGFQYIKMEDHGH